MRGLLAAIAVLALLAGPALAQPGPGPAPAATVTCSSHQWVNTIPAVGPAICSQPANTDVTGLGTASTVNTGTSGATIPLLNATNTWSGPQSFNSADLILKGATSGTITLNAAATAGSTIITLPGGTTDFSATGGASQVVKQTSSGGALTVAQLAASDLSDGNSGSGAVVHVTSPSLVTPTLGAAQATSLGIGHALVSGDLASIYSATAVAQQTFYGDGQFAQASLNTYGNTFEPFFNFQAAGGSFASVAAIASAQEVGGIFWAPWDGAVYRTIGKLACTVDTYAAASNDSGRCSFYTRPDGAAAALQEALRIDKNSHVDFFSAAIPVVSACGTGSPAVTAGSTDVAGYVTIGTTATACTVTFKIAYTGTPVCIAQDITATVRLLSYTVSNAAMVFTMTSNSGDKLGWVCHGAGGQ